MKFYESVLLAAAALGSLPSSYAATCTSNQLYTVESGDTCYSIAIAKNVSPWQNIQTWNAACQAGAVLQVGNTLKLANCDIPGSSSAVKIVGHGARCGATFNAKCASSLCCSSIGWCGTTANHWCVSFGIKVHIYISVLTLLHVSVGSENVKIYGAVVAMVKPQLPPGLLRQPEPQPQLPPQRRSSCAPPSLQEPSMLETTRSAVPPTTAQSAAGTCAVHTPW